MATEPVAATPLARPSILLVDDDPFALDLQGEMLRSMGFTAVTLANDARDILATLLRGGMRPDVIVCDLNMPGMDGVQFLQALDAGAFTGSVIVLSGEGVRILHTVQKLLGGGRLTMLGALEKPARPEALRALLECWQPEPPPGPSPAADETSPFDAEEVRGAAGAGQWLLHYQPKIDLATGGLRGVEALVRWNHPRHGLVYPDRFIAQAEACGVIDTLTEWVLATAVGQMVDWSRRGLALGMAVNVSMDNLLAHDFATRAGEIVRARGALPQDVTLEITESRAMSPTQAPLESLVRLRLLRFKLAIDDFGTGHSSLAQLRDVPFTELKIDRGFVHGARHNQIIRPMLDGSIGLAKRLGLLSVAEGVETLEDLHLLRDIGCDLAQGYFIGRPMPAEALAAWAEAWPTRRTSLFGA